MPKDTCSIKKMKKIKEEIEKYPEVLLLNTGKADQNGQQQAQGAGVETGGAGQQEQ